MIEAAGFVDVKPDDRSKQMVAVINNTKVKVTENIQEYSKVNLHAFPAYEKNLTHSYQVEVLHFRQSRPIRTAPTSSCCMVGPQGEFCLFVGRVVDITE